MKSPHDNIADLGNKKGSDFLSAFFGFLGINIGKQDYWRIAKIMKPDEIFAEAKEQLSVIDSFLS